MPSAAARPQSWGTVWKSGYEYGSAPDVEVYLNADPNNARYEVWIPVVKKDA